MRDAPRRTGLKRSQIDYGRSWPTLSRVEKFAIFRFLAKDEVVKRRVKRKRKKGRKMTRWTRWRRAGFLFYYSS